MSGRSRPSERDLIAIVSGWDKFLELAKLFLLAADIDPDSIVARSTKYSDWTNGLQSASMLICDSLTAKSFPEDDRVRIFPLISDDSISELCSNL